MEASTDGDAIDELRALFAELWETAEILTPDNFLSFKLAWNSINRKIQNPERIIELAVGNAEPVNIRVSSSIKNREQIFLKELRKQVYEQYLPAFTEVSNILSESRSLRDNFSEHDLPTETNRFLNWVRLTYAPGDDAWQNAIIKSSSERRDGIIHYGAIWQKTPDDKVPHNYFNTLFNAKKVFASSESINSASKDEISDGLLSIYAFYEQLRFVKGGESALPGAFWKTNNNDEIRVRKILSYLLHGPGNFIQRFHDTIYNQHYKLGLFGYFCALEMFGTVKPEECPPLNGRMAKPLRFLGYDVRPR